MKESCPKEPLAATTSTSSSARISTSTTLTPGPRKKRSASRSNQGSFKRMKSDIKTSSPFLRLPPNLVREPGLSGVLVRRHAPRRAGRYALGPHLGLDLNATSSWGIKHCLGRKDGTDEFFHVQLLTLSPPKDETKKERIAKMLLHTEDSLLTLLKGEEGVVKKYEFFSEMCLHEDVITPTGQRVYNGLKSRRLVLVLECLSHHELMPMHMRGQRINLQHLLVREKRVEEKEALAIFYNAVDVVRRLHQRNVVHRDLKLSNMVVTMRNKFVTVTNFWLGRHLLSDDDLCTDQRGSPAHVSPEVLSGKPYRGKPSDMWSMGVVLYTMLYGQFPFFDTTARQLFRKIQSGSFTFPADGRVSEDTKNIVRRLLRLNPSERLTAGELQSSLSQVILTWRSLWTSSRSLQVVPEVDMTGDKEEEQKNDNSSEAASTFMLNLARLNSLDNTRIDQENEEETEEDEKIMSNTILLEDARDVTNEEFRRYSSLISQRRPGVPGNSSTTGQPISPEERDNFAPLSPSPMLVPDDSPLLATLEARRRGLSAAAHQPPPPRPAAPDVPLVPTADGVQEAILDLSQQRRQRQTPQKRTSTADAGVAPPPLPPSMPVVAEPVPPPLEPLSESPTIESIWLDRTAIGNMMDAPIISLVLPIDNWAKRGTTTAATVTAANPEDVHVPSSEASESSQLSTTRRRTRHSNARIGNVVVTDPGITPATNFGSTRSSSLTADRRPQGQTGSEVQLPISLSSDVSIIRGVDRSSSALASVRTSTARTTTSRNLASRRGDRRNLMTGIVESSVHPTRLSRRMPSSTATSSRIQSDITVVRRSPRTTAAVASPTSTSTSSEVVLDGATSAFSSAHTSGGITIVRRSARSAPNRTATATSAASTSTSQGRSTSRDAVTILTSDVSIVRRPAPLPDAQGTSNNQQSRDVKMPTQPPPATVEASQDVTPVASSPLRSSPRRGGGTRRSRTNGTDAGESPTARNPFEVLLAAASTVSSPPPEPAGGSMGLREALLRLNPAEVARSDEVIARARVREGEEEEQE